jgi:protein-S-isoprenylcysteine O-methyltransferase Ste14
MPSAGLLAGAVVLLALAVVLARPRARDTANVAVRPPLLLLGLLTLGAALERASPSRPFPEALAVPLGMAAVAAGFLLFVVAFRALREAGTPVQSSRPTTSVVTRGPYHWSRNPIYVSFVLLLLGVALWANSVWIGVMLVPLVTVLRYGVIAHEEAYLDRRLGEPYRRYKASVRRWL